MIASEEEGAAIHAVANCYPMETAPKDGTLLRLRIDYSGEDADNPLWDVERYAWTIGFNNFEHDDIDEWKFAGWDWSQDVFVQGRGVPVGWLPFFDLAEGLSASTGSHSQNIEETKNGQL